MRTLMTVFSGLAALLCLLVGLQLFVLESQISQADETPHLDTRQQFSQWKAQAHTGAIMSLGAGVLIFLFALRHHTALAPRKTPSPLGGATGQPVEDTGSVSVRVFESDAADRYVEISGGDPDPGWPDQPEPRKTVLNPAVAADLKPEGDPSDSIVQSIHEAVAPGRGGPLQSSASSPARPSFFRRLFRWPPRR